MGRYLLLDGDYGFGAPILLDTEQGVLYALDSYGNFNRARTYANVGREVADSLKTHWIPITEFGSDLD